MLVDHPEKVVDERLTLEIAYLPQRSGAPENGRSRTRNTLRRFNGHSRVISIDRVGEYPAKIFPQA